MEKIRDVNSIEDNMKNTVIKNSEIHGYGLFAKNIITEGETLCTLDGQIIDDEMMKELDIDLLNMEYNYLPKQNKWLVRGFLTKYSALNHSREPNVTIRYEPLRIVAISDIMRGEELTIDYRANKFPNYFINKTNANTKYL